MSIVAEMAELLESTKESYEQDALNYTEQPWYSTKWEREHDKLYQEYRKQLGMKPARLNKPMKRLMRRLKIAVHKMHRPRGVPRGLLDDPKSQKAFDALNKHEKDRRDWVKQKFGQYAGYAFNIYVRNRWQ